MREATRIASRWLGTAATLAVLGFGTTQALASPPGEQRDRAACNGGDCNKLCKSIGATGGRCAAGQCFCYWIIPADPG